MTETKSNPKKRINKTTVVLLIIIAVYLLFVPYRYSKYADGNTEEWRAVTYTVVKWQNTYPEKNPYNFTKVYLFPFSTFKLNDLRQVETG